MKKFKHLLCLLMALLMAFSLALFAACGNNGDDGGETKPPVVDPGGDDDDGGDTPAAKDYKIDEEFDNPAVDTPAWDLGDVKDMHVVENGKITITHTGVTDYPSKGKALRVSTDKYPYLAMKVDSLDGPNPMWGAKIMMAGDETPSRTVQADTNMTGLVFFDLTKVEGITVSDDVSFSFFIYILGGEGNSITIDYIRSVENIPGTENFDEQGDITVQDGTVAFTDGIMTVEADEGKTATVTVPVYSDFGVAENVDVFVSEVGAGATWSLSAGGMELAEESGSAGAFGVNAAKLGLEGAETVNYEFKVKGSVSFDQLKNSAYGEYKEAFDYTDDTLTEAWTEEGAAYIEMAEADGKKQMSLYQAYGVSGAAKVSAKALTNVSVYPKLQVVVDAMTEDTQLLIQVNDQTVQTAEEAGTYTANLIDLYLSEVTSVKISFILQATGDFTETELPHAEISSVSLERDAEMSESALPPKAEAVPQEGTLNEQGNNAANWGGNARVIARGGQLWVIQNDGAGYSKGEVGVNNIDLSVNRYLNIKVDGLENASYKVDVIYNPDLAGMQTATVIAENNTQTGIMTFDLYKAFNLNEDSKVAQRVSVGIFTVGNMGSVVKVDYVRIDDKVDEAPTIVDVKPAQSVTDVMQDAEAEVSAALKFPVGAVSIKVEKEGQDVTSQVLDGTTFSASEIGKYIVTYSYDGATSVTRTINVVSKEKPIIGTTAEANNTVVFGEEFAFSATVENPAASGELTYKVTKDGAADDLSAEVLSDGAEGGKIFCTDTTGVYTVTLSYPNAADVSFTVTVDSGWKPQDSTQIITATDGVLTFHTEKDYPKAQKILTLKLADTPYLKITVDEASTANWKLTVGDAVAGGEKDVKAESGDRGTFYLNISSFFGSEFNNEQKSINIGLFVVGTDVDLIVTEFEFVAASELPPAIVDVLPESDTTVAQDETVQVSASLENSQGTVNIKVEKEGQDVTSQVLDGTTFSASEIGKYIVTYSYDGATSVTRTINVVSKEKPIIGTTAEANNTVVFGEEFAFSATVENPAASGELTYKVTKDGAADDLSAEVLSDGAEGGKIFCTDTTGVYTVTLSYPNAADVSFTVTVDSGWIAEAGGVQVITAEDGILHFHNKGYGYPKAKKEFEFKIADTPYLKITIDEKSTATWKLMFGYKTDFENELQSDTTDTGTFYFDLRNGGFGPNDIVQLKEVMFGLMVVGENVDLIVTEFEFVAEKPNA